MKTKYNDENLIERVAKELKAVNIQMQKSQARTKTEL